MKIDSLQGVTGPVSEASDKCPACGAGFTCGMLAGEQTCWCASLPPLLPVPADALDTFAGLPAACLCPECLKRRINEQATKT